MMYFRPRDSIKKFCCKECHDVHIEKLFASEDSCPSMPPLDVSRIADEGYIALVKAIVSRASDDVTKFKPDTQIHKDARRFFESEYFHNLTGLDGKSILRDLLEQGKKKQPETRGRKPVQKSHNRRVRCLENGAVYDSIKEAAKVFGCYATSIQDVCSGRRKTMHGLHFEYVKEGDD
jgi:hypothetical protein